MTLLWYRDLGRQKYYRRH
jgi:hypothetical protein